MRILLHIKTHTRACTHTHAHSHKINKKTHLMLVLVQMMYSISSEYGFWKVKLLVRISNHSLFFIRKRYMTERTWPFNFNTCTRKEYSFGSYFNLIRNSIQSWFSPVSDHPSSPSCVFMSTCPFPPMPLCLVHKCPAYSLCVNTFVWILWFSFGLDSVCLFRLGCFIGLISW